MYSVVNGGFQLVPQGGDGDRLTAIAGLKWHNSFLLNQIERPRSRSRPTPPTSSTPATSPTSSSTAPATARPSSRRSSRWPGGGVEIVLGNGNYLLGLARDGGARGRRPSTPTLYVQDTLVKGNLTANVGLRYDRQGGENLASTVPANPVFPELLPAGHYEGGDSRLRVDDDHSPPRPDLRPGRPAQDPAARQLLALRRPARHRRRRLPQPARRAAGYRLLLHHQQRRPHPGAGRARPRVLGLSGNINPITFEPLQSNAVDPNLDAPITDELLLGIEHALRPELRWWA